jgi:hypothetical protein
MDKLPKLVPWRANLKKIADTTTAIVRQTIVSLIRAIGYRMVNIQLTSVLPIATFNISIGEPP